MIIAGTVNGTMSTIGGVISSVAGSDMGQIMTKASSDPASLVANMPALMVGITVYAVVQIVSMIVNAYMLGGILNLVLKACRGQPYSFGDVFSGGRWLLPIVIGNILTGLGVAFAMPFLIFPAVILALGWMFTSFCIVDQNLGAIDGMSKSWEITNGHKGALFVYGLLVALIMVVGLLACCVGILVAIPLSAISTAYIYLRLTGQPTVS